MRSAAATAELAWDVSPLASLAVFAAAVAAFIAAVATCMAAWMALSTSIPATDRHGLSTAGAAEQRRKRNKTTLPDSYAKNFSFPHGAATVVCGKPWFFARWCGKDMFSAQSPRPSVAGIFGTGSSAAPAVAAMASDTTVQTLSYATPTSLAPPLEAPVAP